MGDIDAIFAFAIAFVFYGAGPLYLASERKKLIRKLQYWIFCVLYDATIFIALQLITGNAISLSGLAVAMLIFGTVFYFIGLIILRKKDLTATPQLPAEPEAGSAPTPEPISSPAPQAVPAQPDTPLSITETWYTCPSCGCLLPTGEACACGYHPPKVEPPKAPVKKQKWPIVAVAVLVVALACSVFYNVEQHNEITQTQVQLSAKQEMIDSKQVMIDYYVDNIRSLQEYNSYLKEDVEYLCGISSDFNTAKLRHTIRQDRIQRAFNALVQK